MVTSQTYDGTIHVRVTSSTQDRLEELALERSEPGARVTPSHIVREAIDEYLDDEPCDGSQNEATAAN